MRIPKLFIIFAISVVFGKLHAQKEPGQAFIKDGQSRITMINEGAKSLSVSLHSFSLFSDLHASIELKPNADTTLIFRQQGLSMASLSLSLFYRFEIPVSPGTNRTIRFNEPEISFEGDFQEVDSFSKQRQDSLKYFYAYYRSLRTTKKLAFEKYLVTVDSLRQIELHYLNAHKNQIPGWYYDLEKTSSYCFATAIKIDYAAVRRFVHQDAYYPNRSDYNFVDSVELNQPYSINTTYYSWMVNNLFSYRSQRELDLDTAANDKAKVRYEIQVKEELAKRPQLTRPEAEDVIESGSIIRKLELIEKDLGAKEFEYFSAEYLNRRMKSAKYPVAMRMYRMFKALHPYNSYLPLLEKTVNDKYLLKPDSKAPTILAYNKESAKKNWGDFHGKIVLLNFWSMSCLPCIREIPKENALLKRFEGKDFEIVKINIDGDPKRWLSFSADRRIDAVNLVAKDRWPWLYRENYQIYGYPKYVLVGKDQKIINENPPRPGTSSLENLIRKNL